MKSKFNLLFLFLLTVIVQSIYGQSSSNPCDTPTTSGKFGDLQNIRIPDYSNYNYYVKTYVHVLEHSDYGKSQTVLGINEAMKTLYNEYDDLGIYLVWDGAIDYIQGDSLYEAPQNHYDDIFSTNHHTDGIDIYLGDSFVSNPRGKSAGIGEGTAIFVQGFEGYLTDPDFIFWPQSSTIIHEIGHAFYLWHTFQGTSDGSNPECLGCDVSDPSCNLPPENNPWVSGDYIWDTPPDPSQGSGWNSSCQYVGGGQDECGNNFEP